MDQHLTVKEATKLTGKSESTIKRFLREITGDADHEDRESILPPHDEVERRREAGEPYVWKIEKSLLLKRFPAEGESAEDEPAETKQTKADIPQSAIIDVLREQLQSKDKQIGTLEQQLDRKDGQIHNLNERMRESNVLMKELQQRLAITAPASQTDAQTIDAEPAKPSQSNDAAEPSTAEKHFPTFAAWLRRKK